MTRSTFTQVLFGVTLLAAIPNLARGQQCPDWSPEFDQIDDPVALQELQSERSQGWPNLNPQTNGGISAQQGIQALDQLIQQYRQELQQAQQAYLATRGSNAPMPKMTGAECRNSSNMGAAMAAACEVDNMQNGIHGAQGTIDLARCRAGLPAVSHAPLDSMGSGAINSGGGLQSNAMSFEYGAASVAGLNVAKRSGMVNSVTRGWRPPAEQQTAQGNLVDSTSLADPFANPAGENSNSAVASGASNDPAGNPGIANSGANGNAITSSDTPSGPQGEVETTAALDGETANSARAASTPVEQLPDTSNGDQSADPSADLTASSGVNPSIGSLTSSSSSLTDSSLSQVIPDSTPTSTDSGDALYSLGLKGLVNLNDSFNENPSSRYVTDQGLRQEGAQFQQGFTVVDDMGATGISSTSAASPNNPAAVQQFDSDSNGLAVAPVKSVLPGYPYLDAVTRDADSWQQTIQNAAGAIKTKAQSLYNRATGAPDCTDPFTSSLDSDCAK